MGDLRDDRTGYSIDNDDADDYAREHVVSDSAECWCGPTVVKVDDAATALAAAEQELDSMHNRLADAEKSFAELWERFTQRVNLLYEADGLISLIRYREARGLSDQTKRDADDLIGRIRRVVP